MRDQYSSGNKSKNKCLVHASADSLFRVCVTVVLAPENRRSNGTDIATNEMYFRAKLCKCGLKSHFSL